MNTQFFRTCRSFILDRTRRVAPYFVPFCGEFHKCSSSDFREAMNELFITTFFSTMPLWIMPLLGPLIFQTDISFVDQLLSTINGGELFVYCAALLGPLIYIITKRYGEVSQEPDKFSVSISFPHGKTFILICALICIFAGFSFSIMKNPVLASMDKLKFNLTGIFWASIVVYLLSLYCFFSASVYRNAMSAFVKMTPSDEDKFADDWKSRSDARSA